jgi:hypothetical protein
MDANERQLRLNIRNFLLVATHEEMQTELKLSFSREDYFRAGCIAELLEERRNEQRYVEREHLTPNDYQMALDSQSACNLSGIVFSFAKVMQRICNDNHDTEARNTHPICQLYAEQIRFLSHGEGGYMAAHAECERLAKVDTTATSV